MKTETKRRFSGPWTPEEVARNEAARAAMMRQDAQRPIGENLAEGAAFVKFAHELAASFAHARRGR